MNNRTKTLTLLFFIVALLLAAILPSIAKADEGMVNALKEMEQLEIRYDFSDGHLNIYPYQPCDALEHPGQHNSRAKYHIGDMKVDACFHAGYGVVNVRHMSGDRVISRQYPETQFYRTK